MQIYGIDLSKDKFDVNYLSDLDQEVRKVIPNTMAGINKFLSTLPCDAVLVAEYTGVYGDLLLFMANAGNHTICMVPGYELLHSMGLVRGKSDPIDSRRIREYGQRHQDKLRPTAFDDEDLYELKELYALRRQLVEQNKQLKTTAQAEKSKPYCSVACHRMRLETMGELESRIDKIEQEMMGIISRHEELNKSYEIITSVNGIGFVTAMMLIIKTRNFRKINNARQFAAYAGVAPYPKSTGKSDYGSRISDIGDKEAKTLLYICARSASVHNKELSLYYIRRCKIDFKNHFYTLNCIANKLLKIIFKLVSDGTVYDQNYIRRDPRVNISH